MGEKRDRMADSSEHDRFVKCAAMGKGVTVVGAQLYVAEYQETCDDGEEKKNEARDADEGVLETCRGFLSSRLRLRRRLAVVRPYSCA